MSGAKNDRLTKAQVSALEKVFSAEINYRLPFQSKAKVFDELLDKGLVAPMERRFGTGPMSAIVKGFQLTHLGRLLYCATC